MPRTQVPSIVLDTLRVGRKRPYVCLFPSSIYTGWPAEVGRVVPPRATCVLHKLVLSCTGKHQIQQDCENAAGELNLYAKKGGLTKG